MTKSLFKTDADVNVEALMSRIRETTRQEVTDLADALSRNESSQDSLAALQPQNFSQDIQAGVLSADSLNKIPLKTQGSKVRIERPVKKLIKWLVHWNTKGQVAFNHSVIRALESISRDLQTTQENFGMLGGLQRDLKTEVRRNLQNKIQVVRLHEDLDRNIMETARLKMQVSNYLVSLDAASVNLAALERKLRRAIEESAQYLRIEFGDAGAAFHNEMNRHIQLVLEETRNQNESLVAHSSELKAELTHKLDELKLRTLRLERTARHPSPEERGGANDSLETPSGAQLNVRSPGRNGSEKLTRSQEPSSPKPVTPQFDYFLFEQQERGPAAEIKRRQSIYLDLFRERSNVVDLGCGRGEFVELLSENGVTVTGVDDSEDMADFCRDRGLPVVQADIFEYLTGLPDEGLDGIFLSQVVEHFPPAQILELVSLCAKKLEPGGVIVAESVNTNCQAALSNFYLDPTHVRPVPPELLRFMLEQQGFRFETFRFSSPVTGSDIDEVLDLDSGFAREGNFYQDYAVVGFKLQQSVLEPNAIVEDRAERSLSSKT